MTVSIRAFSASTKFFTSVPGKIRQLRKRIWRDHVQRAAGRLHVGIHLTAGDVHQLLLRLDEGVRGLAGQFQ